MSQKRNGSTRISDVIVVGAGVIGLSVARELLGHGLRVTVLERNRPGRGASWAAAGMLSPLGEALEPGPFLRFALASLAAYPRFTAELEEETGVELELRRCAKLRVALSGPEAERLRRRHLWAEEQGHRTQWLDPGEVRDLEPALASSLGALYLEEDLRIDNRRLAEALVEAVRLRGGDLREGVSVAELEIEGGRTQGVRMVDGSVHRAGKVLLAAGAWCGRVRGLPSPLPVRPVRGQMVALRPATLPSARVLESEEGYLVPRDDGRVLVGATEEEEGFDASLTAGGVHRILSAAMRLVPDLGSAALDELWTGFRPGTPDGLPILGAVPGAEGLFVATGHFRNGILLTPATARGVAALMREEGADELPPEFAPDRFEGAGGPLSGAGG